MQCFILIFCLLAVLAGDGLGQTGVIVSEAERFQPLDTNGWKRTHMDWSYGSHTYGGMWVSQGAGLGAPADSTGSVAAITVTVPAGGAYRVWSKYQAPPYFAYHHRVEIWQGGERVYTHLYGVTNAPRLWSFANVAGAAPIGECWWDWGVDHDAAEAPSAKLAALSAGEAEIRLITEANGEPAGDRFVDFIVLTPSANDSYIGFNPPTIPSPFLNEAFAAQQLHMRFRNTAPTAQRLNLFRTGHLWPNYASASTNIPAQGPVASGAWSEWIDIGPFCRLVHNEGIRLTLTDAAAMFDVEFARDAAGIDRCGGGLMASRETINVPVTITWDTGATVRVSRELGTELIDRASGWRTANNGRKPQRLAYYGATSSGGVASNAVWVDALKDALGYNTLLPDPYVRLQRDGYHQHTQTSNAIVTFANSLSAQQKQDFRVLSFGDEIPLGTISFNEANSVKFRSWLAEEGITQDDLGGVDPATVSLSRTGDARVVWYSLIFEERERFAYYRGLTRLAEERIGPHVLCGANFSPHAPAWNSRPIYYGPINQWIELFKYGGMSLYWTEDYIFSVPVLPQKISWMFATMRCAVKYNRQPMHFYVMPHAPGQPHEDLRRNMVLAVGYGARHIDNFWVGPQEHYTENYVAWGYDDSFRVVRESIYDSGEVERYQTGGTLRPARVAVVLSRATDVVESRLQLPGSSDPFMARCANAPAQTSRTVCRKEQQMLYLALVHAGHAVDLITEPDIVEGRLSQYQAVYLAGEWFDHHALAALDAWVQSGGVLYANAGLGRFDQFEEPQPGMLQILGLSEAGPAVCSSIVLRTLLELPLTEPMDLITMGPHPIAAIGMRQELTPSTAQVLGTWANGTAAVTVNVHGQGLAYAVGTLSATSYMKTGLRRVPYARGGYKNLYNPTGFDPGAVALVRLGVDARSIAREVVCSEPLVEAMAIDDWRGTLVTLVNWTNDKLTNLNVAVRLSAPPAGLRSVQQQNALPFEYDDGWVTFDTVLEEADYFLFPRHFPEGTLQIIR